jgi:hypothetical protein
MKNHICFILKLITNEIKVKIGCVSLKQKANFCSYYFGHYERVALFRKLFGGDSNLG